MTESTNFWSLGHPRLHTLDMTLFPHLISILCNASSLFSFVLPLPRFPLSQYLGAFNAFRLNPVLISHHFKFPYLRIISTIMARPRFSDRDSDPLPRDVDPLPTYARDMSEEERIAFEVAAGADPGFMQARYGDRAGQKAQDYWNAKRAQGWRPAGPENYPRYQRILVPQGYAPGQIGYGIDAVGIAAEERTRYLGNRPLEPHPRQELNQMNIARQHGYPHYGYPSYGDLLPRDPRDGALGYSHPRYTDPRWGDWGYPYK